MPEGTEPVRCFDVPKGVPENAACLDGHFPGRPIVPGAILLGYAARHLATEGLEISAIRRMKFLRPLLPDQAFTIALEEARDSTNVTWSAGDAVLARARVTLCSHDR